MLATARTSESKGSVFFERENNLSVYFTLYLKFLMLYLFQ